MQFPLCDQRWFKESPPFLFSMSILLNLETTRLLKVRVFLEDIQKNFEVEQKSFYQTQHNMQSEVEYLSNSFDIDSEVYNNNNQVLDEQITIPTKSKVEETAVEHPKKKRRSGYTAQHRSDKKIAKFLERAFSEGLTAACKHYDIPYSTGYYYVHKWDPAVGMKSLERKPSGPEKGKPTKLHQEYQDYIIKKLKENNTLSGNKLAGMLKDKFNVSISKSTINAFLKSEGYSYKTATTEDVETQMC